MAGLAELVRARTKFCCYLPDSMAPISRDSHPNRRAMNIESPDRRKFLKMASTAAAAVLALPQTHLFARHHNDDALLDDLAHRCFQYFWDASDPETGICRDLIHGNPADNLKKGDEARGSTGVTGFCLTALCIGAERKWITRDQAKDRARRALRSYTSGLVPNEHGWFYHFLDIHTGQRWKEVEMSTSDSIWLLAGALTCRQYFHEDHEIADLATLLYSRYDFLWMTNGDGKLLSHGWTPEGFIKYRYDKYCQLAAMYLLGIGSPTHPLPPDAWYAWEREPNSYGSYHYIGTSLLWTYQYPFAWFDFRSRRESRGTKIDWFENCQITTRAHREWCYTDLAKQFPTYTQDIWGITSSSSPNRLHRLGRTAVTLQGRWHSCSLRCRRLTHAHSRHLYSRHPRHERSIRRQNLGKVRPRRRIQPRHQLGLDRHPRTRRRHDPA